MYIKNSFIIEAIKLRKTGMFWEDIADQFTEKHSTTFTANSIKKAVFSYFTEREKEDKNEEKLLELDKLEDIINKLYSQIEENPSNPRFYEALVKVLQYKNELKNEFKETEEKELPQIIINTTSTNITKPTNIFDMV